MAIKAKIKEDKKETRRILKFIKDNPHFSAGMLAKQVKHNKEYLTQLLSNNGVIDDRFSKVRVYRKQVTKPIVKDNPFFKNKSTPKPDGKVLYDKISHEQLNNALMAADSVARKFIQDLNSLDIGAALHIKKENWTIQNRPHFYFKKITINMALKVRVKEVGDSYYVIKL